MQAQRVLFLFCFAAFCLCFASACGDRQLRDAFNSGLARLKANGRYNQIFRENGFDPTSKALVDSECLVLSNFETVWAFPTTTEGVLADILEKKSVTVIHGSLPEDSGPDGNWLVTPPVGLFPEILAETWAEISKHYFGNPAAISVKYLFVESSAGAENAFNALRDGEGDMTDGFYSTAGSTFVDGVQKLRRIAYVDACDFQITAPVFFARNTTGVTSFEQLAGLAVKVATSGSGSIQILRALLPDRDNVEYDTLADLLEAYEEEEIDYLYDVSAPPDHFSGSLFSAPISFGATAFFRNENGCEPEPCEECKDECCDDNGTVINLNFDGMIPGDSCCY
eukprot:TRINITY_DN16432_c0_g1_i1.p1 TRINITY_DN16432_c0_g1~~TRINITY_DN16432_c0_g1_i1.p1  ORF type:complete len:338 (+),score=49.12 TRINITY_DN16432_c0_g1_i1:16-1029(+)